MRQSWLLAMVLLAGVALAADPQVPPAIIDKARAAIQKADTDKDGRLSLLEYAAAKLREATGNGGPYRITPKSDNSWKTLDANKDGLVDAAEYARGHVGDEFRAMDANKDGFLDAAELGATLLRLERAQRGDKASGFVERYDLDKDGKVTRAEFPGSDAVFERLDVNRDGVIDAKDSPP